MCSIYICTTKPTILLYRVLRRPNQTNQPSDFRSSPAVHLYDTISQMLAFGLQARSRLDSAYTFSYSRGRATLETPGHVTNADLVGLEAQSRLAKSPTQRER